MFIVLVLLTTVIGQISLLRVLEQPSLTSCNKEPLPYNCHLRMPNCSADGWVKPRHETPGMHPAVHSEVSVRTDATGNAAPVLFLRLTQPSDGSIYSLNGTEVQVLEVATGSNLCVRCIFMDRLPWVSTHKHEPWCFVLDQIVVDPGLKYQISVSNLPKPDVGRHPKVQTITVPGCEDAEVRRVRACLENGSLWDPNLTWSVSDLGGNGGVAALTFNTGQFSDLFRVSIHQPDIDSDLSFIVFKDNHTLVSVNFSLEAWQLQLCNFAFVIKPFFVRCMNNCVEYQQNVSICPSNTMRPGNRHFVAWIVPGLTGLVLCAWMTVLLSSNSKKDISSSSHGVADKEESEGTLTQEPSKVLIIYSLDHPLYTEIVLKLCAFLRASCGTDATLDLLDSSWISAIGRVQWLDIQRARLTRSPDKVLLLCSPGVQAKWKAMCRGVRAETKEDTHAPMGDMLTPALSLIVPDFVRTLSFPKYIVAYFEEICSETDIPAPFNIAVKYQLMKHFEELFFRLLDKEKHEPGKIKHIEGIGGYEYHRCPTGRALRDAIETFRAYQLANPDWFEMEVVDADEDIKEDKLQQDEGAEICEIQNELQVTGMGAQVVMSDMVGPRQEAEESLAVVTHVIST